MYALLYMCRMKSLTAVGAAYVLYLVMLASYTAVRQTCSLKISVPKYVMWLFWTVNAVFALVTVISVITTYAYGQVTTYTPHHIIE